MKSIVGILFNYVDADGVEHDSSARGIDLEDAKRKVDIITKGSMCVTYKCIYGADIEDDE